MRPEDRVRRNDVVRLADLTVHTMVLEDLEFSNCRVVGPAVLLPLGSTTIAQCSWDAPGFDALFWEIPPDRTTVVGAIGARDCIFSGCSFVMVGLAGPRELREQLEAGFS